MLVEMSSRVTLLKSFDWLVLTNGIYICKRVSESRLVKHNVRFQTLLLSL